MPDLLPKWESWHQCTPESVFDQSLCPAWVVPASPQARTCPKWNKVQVQQPPRHSHTPGGVPNKSSYIKPMILGAREANPRTSTSSMSSTGYHCPVIAPECEYKWVPEGRVLRYTTLQKQKDSNAALQMAAKRLLPWKCPNASSVQLPSSGRGRWKGKGAAEKPEHRCLCKLEVQIHLPSTLEPLLLQDWKLVTVKKKLFTLPAKKPVNAILEEYVASQQNCKTAFKTDAIGELVSTLQKFFDMVLANQLLYQFEKPQHQEILAHMAHICLGAHLLRLFSQLGPMLSCAPLGAGSLHVLLSHLQDFLKYFASNPSLLFKAATDYQAASAEYQHKVG